MTKEQLPFFIEEIYNLLENVDYSADYNILCGDFNIALNKEIGTVNYRHINNPRGRQAVFDLMRQYDVSDIYRDLHPNKKWFTWRRRNLVKQARLDLFFAS